LESLRPVLGNCSRNSVLELERRLTVTRIVTDGVLSRASSSATVVFKLSRTGAARDEAVLGHRQALRPHSPTDVLLACRNEDRVPSSALRRVTGLILHVYLDLLL